MSQTETLLLVVLGFSLATLIALFVGRFLWAAALKIGARRMQKQVPSSLVGLQTERNRLRAEFAMLSQRLGSRLEATNIRMAEAVAEVSRHRNRLEMAEAQVKERDAKIAALEERLAVLTAQLAESESVQQQYRDLMQAHVPLENRPLPTVLPLAPENAEAAEIKPDLRFDPVSVDRLQQRIGQLNEMAQAAEENSGPLSDTGLAARITEAERENDDLNRELERLDAEWSKRLEDLKLPPEAMPEEPESGKTDSPPIAVANVISLANRIRDLKKGLKSSDA